jgi:chromate transporter
MSDPSAPIALTAHLALVSSISFGGFPTVLPDVRNFVVGTHGWMTNQEFANLFAMAQSTPRPNMILMMSFVGWKVWGFPGAVASAFATFGPPCTIYCATYRVWDRFRDAPWQRIVRLGLVPVVMGLVIASGIVMTRAADTSWRAVAVTIAVAVTMLATRLNPMWILLTGAALGVSDCCDAHLPVFDDHFPAPILRRRLKNCVKLSAAKK